MAIHCFFFFKKHQPIGFTIGGQQHNRVEITADPDLGFKTGCLEGFFLWDRGKSVIEFMMFKPNHLKGKCISSDNR